MNAEQIVKAVLNLITVSLLEEIFATLVCLTLLIKFGMFITDKGAKDYSIFLPNPKNILRFSIVVLIPAITVNFLKYIVGVKPEIVLLLFALSMYISVIVAYDFWYIKSIEIKSFTIKLLVIKRVPVLFLGVLAGILANMIIEIPYIYGFTYFLDKPISEINNNISLNFILALPERLLEYAVVLVYIMRKRASQAENAISVDIFKTIKRNKVQMALGIGVLSFSLLWLVTFSTVFVINRNIKFMNLPLVIHALLVTGVLLVPLVCIATYTFGVYIQRKNELLENRLNEKRLTSYTNIARSFTKNRNYDKVNAVLNDIDTIIRRANS